MNQEEARQLIESTVKDNEVALFMKGTADFPQCGFSGQVVQILNYYKVPFKSVDVLANEALRSEIKAYSNWPTIPQLYVKGDFVGGCDIVSQMAQGGQLESLFKEKGVTPSP